MQEPRVKNAPAEQDLPPPYQDVPPGHESFAPPPNMIGGQSVTIVHPGVVGATIIVGTPVGSEPTTVICRSCHAQVTSRVNYRPTLRTHLIALLLCIFVCWPCVCVPYCVDSCNGVDHYCPNCNAFIGSYNN